MLEVSPLYRLNKKSLGKVDDLLRITKLVKDWTSGNLILKRMSPEWALQ